MPTLTHDERVAPEEPTRVKPLLRGWLHAGACLVMLVAGPLLIARAPSTGTGIALGVYVLAVVALFGVSAAFHRITWSPAARRRMRRADHATIFIAIAGSYTAVAALSLRGWAQITILALVWGGAAGGITLRQVWLDVPKWAVAVPYVVVGWCALLVLPQLLRGLGTTGFVLLVLGGAAYTFGALTYALRKPDPWPGVFGYHEIFHSWTIVGATLHFVAISAYALPRA